MNKRTSIAAAVLTVIMTFMEMSALPAAFFCKIQVGDIEPIYFSLMLNFLIAFTICFLCRRTVLSEWNFGLCTSGIVSGLKKYGIVAIFATIIAVIAFCAGLAPFDNKPTIWRVVIEGIVYYVGVAIMEEIYLRGLLQNLIEKWFGNRKHASLNAVIISSVLFGLGHIFGAIGHPVITIICKTIWAVALGVYFGSVYVKTRNLWVPIILHFLIDLCGIPFCFSKSNEYPIIGLAVCFTVYSLLGIYGIYILSNNVEKDAAI